MCHETEAREMPQGSEGERKSLRLSYLIADPSFLSRCEIGQFNSDTSETKYQLNAGLVSFLMGILIRKVRIDSLEIKSRVKTSIQ